MAENNADNGTRPATSSSLERPAERYGAARAEQGLVTGKVLAVVLGVLGVAFVIAIVAYFYTQFTQEKIGAEVVNSKVLDESTLELTVDVSSNRPDRTAYCILQAKDVAKAEVGRREIVVPAGQEHTRVTATLATTNRASIGDVYGCDFDLPAYLSPEGSPTGS